LAELHLV